MTPRRAAAFLELAEQDRREQLGVTATLQAVATHDPKKLQAMIKDLSD